MPLPTTRCRWRRAFRDAADHQDVGRGHPGAINVTAATPIIDVKRDTTTTNVTLEELQNIPTARDPWVIMQTVPTIYVDRVNIGGSESGQQSNYIGKGSPTTDNTWNIDGVPVTDMGATGSTPTLLRVRHVPGDVGDDRQRRRAESDARRAAEPGAQEGAATRPTATPASTFENQSLQANNIPPDLAASLGGTGRQGQPHRSLSRRELRSRRADLQGPSVRLGIPRLHRRPQPDADQPAGRDQAEELGVQGRLTSSSRPSVPTSRSSAATSRRTGAAWGRPISSRPRGTRRVRPTC